MLKKIFGLRHCVDCRRTDGGFWILLPLAPGAWLGGGARPTRRARTRQGHALRAPRSRSRRPLPGRGLRVRTRDARARPHRARRDLVVRASGCAAFALIESPPPRAREDE